MRELITSNGRGSSILFTWKPGPAIAAFRVRLEAVDSLFHSMLGPGIEASSFTDYVFSCQKNGECTSYLFVDWIGLERHFLAILVTDGLMQNKRASSDYHRPRSLLQNTEQQVRYNSSANCCNGPN